MKNYQLEPVSYTHLDVYKRQLLNLWVKCVSAERGHGSKSRVHFLGYSLGTV